MNKKFLVIGGIALALIALAFLFLPSKDKKKTANKNTSTETNETVTSTSSGFSNFSDAPAPANENSALEVEAEKLWPHLATQDTSARRKEKVREEWNSFASKYPKNFYIPAELKAPMTETEAAEKRKEIDIVTKMESKLAVVEINSRKAEPGSAAPKAPVKPDVTPEEQRIYIGFKTKELESRIQLIEYSIENSGINGDQLTIARKDISNWKKELTDLQEVEKKIPNS
jgi:type IV secretory pathway VirB10-like protein